MQDLFYIPLTVLEIKQMMETLKCYQVSNCISQGSSVVVKRKLQIVPSRNQNNFCRKITKIAKSNCCCLGVLFGKQDPSFATNFFFRALFRGVLNLRRFFANGFSGLFFRLLSPRPMCFAKRETLDTQTKILCGRK